jgi:ABC-2 type transport system ATP-binding protein
MRDMRLLIRRLADQGITVLLSSHLMAEVEELCDRVAIVGSGRVLYEGALDDLIASAAGRYELRTTDDAHAAEIASRYGDVVETPGGLSFDGDERAAAELSVALGLEGIGITALVPRTATLEELFLSMTEAPSPNGRAKAVVG